MTHGHNLSGCPTYLALNAHRKHTQRLTLLLPGHRCEAARPGIESSDSIVELVCRQGPVDSPIGLAQFTGKCGPAVILRQPHNFAVCNALQRFRQQLSPGHGQLVVQCSGRIVWRNGHHLLFNNVSGVHALIHKHNRDAGLTLTIHNSPLNRGRTTITG